MGCGPPAPLDRRRWVRLITSCRGRVLGLPRATAGGSLRTGGHQRRLDVSSDRNDGVAGVLEAAQDLDGGLVWDLGDLARRLRARPIELGIEEDVETSPVSPK